MGVMKYSILGEVNMFPDIKYLYSISYIDLPTLCTIALPTLCAIALPALCAIALYLYTLNVKKVINHSKNISKLVCENYLPERESYSFKDLRNRYLKMYSSFRLWSEPQTYFDDTSLRTQIPLTSRFFKTIEFTVAEMSLNLFESLTCQEYNDTFVISLLKDRIHNLIFKYLKIYNLEIQPAALKSLQLRMLQNLCRTYGDIFSRFQLMCEFFSKYNIYVDKEDVENLTNSAKLTNLYNSKIGKNLSADIHSLKEFTVFLMSRKTQD